ncbi:unnamed protein product [Sympodiomycopsis kandeliae]
MVPLINRPPRRFVQLATGLFKERHWEPHWSSLPGRMRYRLQQLPNIYPSHRDTSDSTNRRPHILPFRLEPSAMVFPWRALKLCGQPIRHFTVKAAREWLARNWGRGTLVPDWTFDQPADAPQWQKVWDLLLQLPLDDEVESCTRRFLLRRTPLARSPQLVPEDSDDNSQDSDDSSYPQEDDDVQDTGDNDVSGQFFGYARSFTQAQRDESSQAFHVVPCDHQDCQAAMSSPGHDYVECQRVRPLWYSAKVLLARWMDATTVANLPLDVYNIDSTSMASTFVAECSTLPPRSLDRMCSHSSLPSS